LVEKSLVRKEGLGPARFGMLETVREFGAEQQNLAGEVEVMRRRQATWCLEMAERAAPDLFGWATRRGLVRLDAERDNLRVALAWAVEKSEAEIAQRLAFATVWYWYVTGQAREGAIWAERALTCGPTPPALRAQTMVVVAWLAYEQGQVQRAGTLLESIAPTAVTSGRVAVEAHRLMVLGMVSLDLGQLDRAEICFRDSLALHEASNDATWPPYPLKHLGVVAYLRGDLARAQERFDAALARFRAMGNDFGAAIALINLARLARRRGDLARALALYGESLALRADDGDNVSILGCLQGMALTAVLAGLHAQGGRLFGAAEALREAIDATQPRGERRIADALSVARSVMGEGAFAVAWATGRSLPLTEAVAEALAIPAAMAGAALDEPPHSRQHGLTPRELEVLRLLAAGHSNPAIAEALFISTRTAQTHVQHILDKLDVSSRAEAAVYAAKHGLLA
jgi:non-specific serine/threonine protein kinase